MDSKSYDIPNNWKRIKLGEFVEKQKGKKPKHLSKKLTDKYSIPYVDIKAFEQNIVQQYTDGEGCVLCEENDFLIVWDGSRSGLVGKAIKGALGSTLVRVNFPNVFNDFAYYFLQSKYLEINSRAKGSGTPHVDPDLLWNYDFPLPPLPEQHRIVAKIEELFSELDKGIASLKKAKEQLKVYRQSVLKWAFEGKLTEEWRKTNKTESAETLLKQIKEEKEHLYHKLLQEWNELIKAWEDRGKKGKKPLIPRKRLSWFNFSVDELNKLDKLPKKWIWIRSGNIFSFVTSGSRGWAKYYSNEGAIFIRITNLHFNTLELDLCPDKIQYVSLPNEVEGKRTKVQEGDFLFSITGDLGMFAISPRLTEAYVNQHISLARPIKANNLKYFGFWIISKAGGNYYLNQKSKGATKAGLGLDDIQEIPIPLCSLQEQNLIVQEIESRLNVADKLEKTIDLSFQQSEALKQSILKRAFEGRLV